MFLDFSVRCILLFNAPRLDPSAKVLELVRMYVFWNDASDSTMLLK